MKWSFILLCSLIFISCIDTRPAKMSAGYYDVRRADVQQLQSRLRGTEEMSERKEKMGKRETKMEAGENKERGGSWETAACESEVGSKESK